MMAYEADSHCHIDSFTYVSTIKIIERVTLQGNEMA
jgi:hypothetical protein